MLKYRTCFVAMSQLWLPNSYVVQFSYIRNGQYLKWRGSLRIGDSCPHLYKLVALSHHGGAAQQDPPRPTGKVSIIMRSPPPRLSTITVPQKSNGIQCASSRQQRDPQGRGNGERKEVIFLTSSYKQLCEPTCKKNHFPLKPKTKWKALESQAAAPTLLPSMLFKCDWCLEHTADWQGFGIGGVYRHQ